ncbi:MAG: methylenetetrahydrofolate reductase, partial [Eubacteriales bacterium]|nr:methylenetetrahydrofolate reductase [Eubacteriales bacterium]
MKHTENMKRRMTLSFEVFPPRTEVGMNNLTGPGGVLERLCSLHPDHISCTYGAGGTSVGQQIPILSAISACGTMPLAHLTCVGSTREQLYDLLQSHLDRGVDHVLALRGDLPVGQDNTGGDLHYATELVRFIRESFGDRFHLSVAGSPEGHIESRSLAADIAFLRMKQDEGANAIMTQLCWDMEQFKRWMDEIRRAGVILPVIVGIMPITNAASTINMALSRNACVMPRALCEIISRHWIFPNPFAPKEDPEIIEAKKAAFEEEGFAYT